MKTGHIVRGLPIAQMFENITHVKLAISSGCQLNWACRPFPWLLTCNISMIMEDEDSELELWMKLGEDGK